MTNYHKRILVRVNCLFIFWDPIPKYGSDEA